jgi:hypothetical protein
MIPQREASRDEQNGSRRGCHGLHFPVAVGMIMIGRPPCVLDGQPHEAGAEHIEGRLDTIRNEGMRAAEYAAQDLHQGENDIRKDAGDDEPAALASPAIE